MYEIEIMLGYDVEIEIMSWDQLKLDLKIYRLGPIKTKKKISARIYASIRTNGNVLSFNDSTFWIPMVVSERKLGV